MPEYARGKTASEILARTNSLHETVRTRSPPAPASPQAPAPGYSPTADEWIVRPEEATRKVADELFAARMAPALQGLQGIAQQFASTQRMLAESKFAEDFRRWGPEIDQMMAVATPEQRTFENYEKVVTFIRGKHVEEIASEKAQRLAAQGGLGERSGGNGMAGAPNPSGVDFSKLPQGLGKVAERVGLTETMVRDFCKANNMTPEQWMEQALNEQVITSVAPFSYQIKPESLGVKRAFDS